MSETVIKSGISRPTVDLYPGKRGKFPSRAEINVQVIDNLVQGQVPGTDAFETIKVGIPYQKNGKVEWREVVLAYEGKSPWRETDRAREDLPAINAPDEGDNHGALLSNVNASLVKKMGIYVKAEYAGGEVVVWGQHYGDDTKPNTIIKR